MMPWNCLHQPLIAVSVNCQRVPPLCTLRCTSRHHLIYGVFSFSCTAPEPRPLKPHPRQWHAGAAQQRKRPQHVQSTVFDISSNLVLMQTILLRSVKIKTVRSLFPVECRIKIHDELTTDLLQIHLAFSRPKTEVWILLQHSEGEYWQLDPSRTVRKAG